MNENQKTTAGAFYSEDMVSAQDRVIRLHESTPPGWKRYIIGLGYTNGDTELLKDTQPHEDLQAAKTEADEERLVDVVFHEVHRPARKHGGAE